MGRGELLAEIDVISRESASPRSLALGREQARTLNRLTERLGLSASEAELLTGYALDGYELLDPVKHEPDPGWPKFINNWKGQDEKLGERPAWLDDAIELYRRGSSARAVAELISGSERVQISKDQMRSLLKQAGVQMRSPGAEPLDVVFANNLEMTDPARLRDRLRSEAAQMAAEGVDETNRALELRDRFYSLAPRFVKLYSQDPIWSDPKFTNAMGHHLSKFNAHSANPVAGLVFEDVIATSLRNAGHRVDLYKAGNPGADLQMEALLDGKRVLLNISCKSLSAERQNETGAEIRLSSLAKHQIGMPDSVADLREAITAGIEHSESYEQISFLQAVTEKPPVAALDDEMWRYNLIDVPKKKLRDQMLAVAADDDRLAAAIADAKRRGRKSIDVPIRDAAGNQLFKVHVTDQHVAVTAISPAFYRVSCSWWVPRDPEADETLPYQRSSSQTAKVSEGPLPERSRPPPDGA